MNQPSPHSTAPRDTGLRRLAKLKPAILLAVLMMLAALAWLGWRLGDSWIAQPEVTARPALWHASKDKSQLWLLGTIHAVPKGERWLSPAIEQAAEGSDRLFLEVTGLEAERKSRAIFERLSKSAGLPAIEARLPPAEAEQYRALAERHSSALRGLDGYESWAAALLVNAAAASTLSLSSAEGGETVLKTLFERADKPVLGLETIEEQLGLFDSLAESEQRRLLAQSVREIDDAPRLYRTLHDAWASGDVARLQREFFVPLEQAPLLRAALLDGRNRRWALTLDATMRMQPGQAFVAVGAGHLLGNGSVQARLEAMGWKVERVQ